MHTAPSRLFGDARRAWVAFAATMVIGFPVSFALPFVLPRDWVLGHELAFNAAAILGAFSLYCLGYTVLTWRVMRRLEGEDLRAALHDSTPRNRIAKVSRALSGGGAGAWSVSAALSALGLAVALAFIADLRAEPAVLALTAVTVVSSWLLVPTSYAVEYLREDAARPGLRFPGDETLCFASYFYLAVQISTTFSSSDVEVTTTAMRRRVTGHSLLAFVFSSVIIALVVSAILTAAPR